MIAIEEPIDIAEEMADRIGIYGACNEHDEGESAETCMCRCHFVSRLTTRMREAVMAEMRRPKPTTNEARG